jgi:D-alanine-D-alanine ligase
LLHQHKNPMNIDLKQIKVWVLAPCLVTNDEHIDYYYDFSQSIEEYTKVFAELDMDWQWQPVTMDDYKQVIDGIAKEKKSNKLPVVFNLCDGDEINGTPGVSIIHYLEEKQLLYTGSNAYFYDITTSKIPMKKAFDEQQVPTAKWEAINSKEQKLDGIFNKLGSPIIVKPSVSGGSMGVGIKNVVKDNDGLKEQVNKMFDGYRGWQLTTDGIIAESFVDGPEYTVMIVGNHNHPETAIIYTPVERVFHSSLPATEKFLSFDRLWEIYEEEQPMPNEENFYEYAVPDIALHEKLKQISWDAYVACKGIGYTRVDLRMDETTGEILVLEVNAQCGLSEDENFTSIGAILKFSNVSFKQLVQQILENTITNAESKSLKISTSKLKVA